MRIAKLRLTFTEQNDLTEILARLQGLKYKVKVVSKNGYSLAYIKLII